MRSGKGEIGLVQFARFDIYGDKNRAGIFIAGRSLVSIMHGRSPMLRSDMARKSMRMFVAFLLMLAPTFAQAPDEVTPLLKQGETLIHAGQLVQAQEFFENAQRKFPGQCGYFFRSGHGLLSSA